jgi:hypothetical protein
MTGSSDTATTNSSNPDVVLIGAGIMSTTLAVILACPMFCTSEELV